MSPCHSQGFLEPREPPACPGTEDALPPLHSPLRPLFHSCCYCCNHLITASVHWLDLESAAVGEGQGVCQPENCCGWGCAALLNIPSGIGLKKPNIFVGRGRQKTFSFFFFFQSLSVFSFEKIISLLCCNLFHRLILCFDCENLNASLKPFAIFCLLIKMET